MNFDDNILLKLRREFSGNEKYRLFLQQLDRLEKQLKDERELNTRLMKENIGLKDDNMAHTLRIKRLEEQLSEYDRENVGKTCVSVKTHNKAIKQKNKWEALYIETYHKLKDLKKTIDSELSSKDESF